METLLISGENGAELKPLLELAKKLGLKARTLTKSEIEDWIFAQKIEDGIKSGVASRDDIMRELGR